jgi:PAS domain S-box-containing protein
MMTPLWDALQRLQPPGHLCSVYGSEEEQFASAIPFIHIGLERGEKCLYVVDDEDRLKAVRAAMKGAGIDVRHAIRSGALVVATKHRAYLSGNHFEPSKVLSFWREQREEALRSGYAGLRATGETDWVSRGAAGIERWMEYESLLTNTFAEIGCLALCQYDRRVCSPELILNVIRTHPLLVYGDRVCENFYFVPPEEFLVPDCAEREVDRLLHNVFERARTVHELKLFRTLIDRSNEAIEVIEPETLRILDVNEKACQDLGYSRQELLSMSVFDIDPTADAATAKVVWNRLMNSGSLIIESRHRRKDGSTFPVEVNLKYVQLDRSYVVSVVRDTTELRRAQEQLQDEQRRIARELHDSTAQELAGLRMNLGIIKRSSKKLDRKAVRALNECQSLAEQCAREIRTLSYLLHPPLLDEFGLVLALRGYVQGFAKRSGIRVGLDIDPRLEQSRLPQRFETSLFRIVQESLTNISRHSGSQSATIRLKWQEDEVVLEIQDRGRGIKAEVVRAIASHDVTALGVGIPGMRERVRQLEGQFRIETNQRGTSLSVVLPVKDPSCATQETTTASTATN